MADDKNGGPNFVQAWREHRGLSREQLAEMLDTSATMIWSLEIGERGLSAKWLRKLGKALEAAPGDLLQHPPTELPVNVIDIWSRIDDVDKPQALRVLEAFEKKVG